MTDPAASQTRRPDPVGVPKRFSRTGEVQTWPGVSIICHVAEGSPPWHALHAIQDALRRDCPQVASQKMHLMPPQSWHMTILDGVNEEWGAQPGFRPPGDAQLPLDVYTKDFVQRLSRVTPALAAEGLAPPYRLQVSGISVGSAGMHLQVKAENDDEERRLRRLRDFLADTIGFRIPGHDKYQWHIGFCYLFKYLDADEPEVRRVVAGVASKVRVKFTLDTLQFCKFENLHKFDRLLSLA